MTGRKPCDGRNSNVCVAEGCYGEACLTTPTPATRAAAGAALLDQTWARWWTVVEPVTLHQGSTRHDILGQLYGHYTTGLDDVLRDHAPDLDTLDAQADFAADHGFDTYATGDDFPDLTAAWTDEINNRRMAATVGPRLVPTTGGAA